MSISNKRVLQFGH